MSCHGCASKFTLFSKEHCCPSCGFAYCSKCLKYKAVVPKLGEKEHKICKSCFLAITENGTVAKSTRQEYCPPESFLKRLESLENPSRPPITLYRQDTRMQQLKAGLSETDREIAERLEKLKEERNQRPVPTEEEVARRLAILRGEDPNRMSELSGNKKVFMPPDTRSDQEKINSLLKQFAEEAELDAMQPDPAEEIAQRLAKLRGVQATAPSAQAAARERTLLHMDPANTAVDDDFGAMPVDDACSLLSQLERKVQDDINQAKSLKGVKLKLMNKKDKGSEQKDTEDDEFDDEEEIEKTVKKALHEAALEEKQDEEEIEGTEKEEEFPWCIICNENASIRCLDCDGDLYCKGCFIQGHDEFELQHHKHEPYKPPK